MCPEHVTDKLHCEAQSRSHLVITNDVGRARWCSGYRDVPGSHLKRVTIYPGWCLDVLIRLFK